MPKKPQGRLELTWMGKDLALIPFEDGKYDYAWVEPTDPRVTEVRAIEETSTVGTVEATFDEDGTVLASGAEDNLLIIGDSGDALRSLGTIPEYADRYAGRVKLVYIDPPFNTGQTFDHYSDQMEHSVWLTFMRDRIRDIKPLMASDASIWVHLDDAENHRMRSLLDEEFGAENFVAEVAWKNGVHVRNDAKGFSRNHDVILVYAASSGFTVNKLVADNEMLARYSSPDGDPEPWQSIASSAPGAASHQGMVYAIQHPITGKMMYPPKGSCWRRGQADLLRIMSEWAPYELRDLGDAAVRADICGVPTDEVRVGVEAMVLSVPLLEAADIAVGRRSQGSWPDWYFTGADGTGGLRVKGRMPKEFGRVPFSLWEDTDRNDTAKREIKALFPRQSAFATPKPERLLERVIHIGSNPGDIVLDCFAGSGTTAAVAHKMGRRWVTVELLDSTAKTFIVPRLTKVVDGSDRGGISVKTERVDATAGGLPEGVTPDEAREFTRLLSKFSAHLSADSFQATMQDVADETGMAVDVERSTDGASYGLSGLRASGGAVEGPTPLDAQSLKILRAAARTRDEKTVRWSGGGGFTIARLGPSMYDVEDGAEGRTEVFLSPAATNGAWSAAIAGQLGYRRTAEHPVFAGQKGRERLAVIDGVADESVIRDLHAHLAPDETMLVVAKAALDDTSALLRELAPGSTLRVAPAGLLQKGAVIR